MVPDVASFPFQEVILRQYSAVLCIVFFFRVRVGDGVGDGVGVELWLGLSLGLKVGIKLSS